MNAVLEIALTVLSLLGLTALGWCLLGRLLCPVPARGVHILIEAEGDAARLEQTVRGLVLLRSLGLLACPIEIADRGLSSGGLDGARRLAERWPGISISQPQH